MTPDKYALDLDFEIVTSKFKCPKHGEHPKAFAIRDKGVEHIFCPKCMIELLDKFARTVEINE